MHTKTHFFFIWYFQDDVGGSNFSTTLFHSILTEARDHCSFLLLKITVVIFRKQCPLLACMYVYLFPHALICLTVNAPHRGCVTLSVQRVFLRSSTPFHLLQPALPVSHKIRTLTVNNVSLVTLWSLFWF